MRLAVRCIGKFSVYLLEIKIQITDIFDVYLLRKTCITAKVPLRFCRKT